MAHVGTFESIKLGGLLQQVQRPMVPDPGREYVEIGIRSHGRGIFSKPATSSERLGRKRVFEVVPECLSFNIVFAWEGAVAVTTTEHIGMIASHRFPMYRVDTKRALLSFVNLFFRTRAGLRILRLASPGGAGRNRTLNQRQLMSAEIPLPSIPQQRVVTSALLSYDECIHQLDSLLQAKQSFRRGVSRQLLTGERRFPQFSAAWTVATIGGFLTESRMPSDGGVQEGRLTIRLHGKGVVPSTNRRKGSNATKYYRRAAGQFIYSKLDFLNGASGVIPTQLDGYETTSDLPAFDVSPSLDARWLAALTSQPWFYQQYVGLTAGGRKAKRMNTREFLKIQTSFPALDEQRSTMVLLRSLETEVQALERLRDLVNRERLTVAEVLFGLRDGAPKGEGHD